MGSYTDWDSLQNSSGSFPAYTASNVDVSGYIFDLFATDVSLAVDPSFAAALLAGGGFATVDAVASMDMPASTFNTLIQITVDSSDLDNTPANDVVYSFGSANPFANIQVSNATVKSGHTNAVYGDSPLDKDLVRHIAKEITGGYAVADIFANEAQLVTDVSDQNAAVGTGIGDIITDLSNVGGVTADAFPQDTDQNRAFNIAQTLFGLNVNDSVRQGLLFDDLSGNATGSATNTANLRFAVGDAIAIRVNYDPAASPATGMGTNPVSSRSYKVLIKLT